MVNDIKLQTLGNATPLAKPLPNEANHHKTAHTEEVTITNELKSLASNLLSVSDNTNNNQKVLELKQQIDQHQYKIDLDALAKKMLKTLILDKNHG